MEFDIPIRVTAFLYDLEKKLILFVGAVKVRLDSEQGVAEVTPTKGKAIEGFHIDRKGVGSLFTTRLGQEHPVRRR